MNMFLIMVFLMIHAVFINIRKLVENRRKPEEIIEKQKKTEGKP